MVIHVAIVEDEEIHQKALREHLLRYAGENDVTFNIRVFANPILICNDLCQAPKERKAREKKKRMEGSTREKPR